MFIKNKYFRWSAGAMLLGLFLFLFFYLAANICQWNPVCSGATKSDALCQVLLYVALVPMILVQAAWALGASLVPLAWPRVCIFILSFLIYLTAWSVAGLCAGWCVQRWTNFRNRKS